MLDRVGTPSSSLASHFRPSSWADQGRKIIPMMRAYGGIAPRAGSVALPRTLGRIGNLEVRLAAMPRRCAAPRNCAGTSSTRRCKPSPTAPPASPGATSTPSTPSATTSSSSTTPSPSAPALGAPRPAIVGTYRLLRQEVAERNGGFYTASEFDISGLLARHRGKRFLELGRSCVLPAYRNKRTVELLWHGIWTYVLAHRIDVMFGCASLEGTDPRALSLELSFLHHHARPPADWAASALPSRHVAMGRLSPEAIDMKKALHALPPLVKGYLRLGAYIGEGAVVDRQFNTTDVLVILPVSAISPRYIGHFGATADRHAA